jgi:hypothetical protein
MATFSGVPSRAREPLLVAAAAAIVTVVLALPVLRDPSNRMFGAEIVGRHHDPFTVMQQFEQPIRLGAYSQPATDIPGALVARLTGPIAAYNWMVLLTFPIAAAATFVLARRLDLSGPAAAFAALAFAFSPFHVAQSAYHPHIAQVQWIPLYLLALWNVLERVSAIALAGLVLAVAGVALSNVYGGLIAAVVTPVALTTYWLARARGTAGAGRRLFAASAALTIVAAAGLAYVRLVSPAVLSRPEVFAVDREDLVRHGATWWAYLMPPVVNPWLGEWAGRVWADAQVREGLLEQQVTIGAAVVALGLIAIVVWNIRFSTRSISWAVPILVPVALTAFVCSLAPDQTILGMHVTAPSAWLYSVAPMFRSYARFGVVVQLMAALLAGLGLDALLRSGWRGARIAGAGFVAMAAMEYAVVPGAVWRDVLPTLAHRSVVEADGRTKALDCTPFDPRPGSVTWLTQGRIAMPGGAVGDCSEPHLTGKLAALGYTHMILRDASEPGARVVPVTAPVPVLYTGEMTGFFPREAESARTWRWMTDVATWRVINTTQSAVEATLSVELQAFATARHLEVRLDGISQDVWLVTPDRRVHDTRMMAVPPGEHILTFRAIEPPGIADALLHNGDPRPLSVAFGAWTWQPRGAR